MGTNLDCFVPRSDAKRHKFVLIRGASRKIIRSIRVIRSSLFIIYSLRSDFTGFIVAARRLRKVTTAIVTPKTANSARANTQTCNGT